MVSATIALQERTTFDGNSGRVPLVPEENTTSREGLAANAPTNAVDPLAPITRKQQITVLINGFLAILLTIGPNLSYGVFQNYYVSSPLSPLPASQSSSRGLVAFVGTLGAGLTWGGSIYVNPLMARCKSFAPIATIGAVLMSAGFLLASWGSQTWHFLLTQGLVYGVGSSMLYFPLISVAPEYFDQRRGAAMGFILSAAGVGGVVYSLLISVLLDKVGVGWTLRIMAAMNLVLALPIAFAAMPSRSMRRRPTMVNLALAKKPAFVLQALAALLQASGNFVPMTFTAEFSTVLGYTASFGAVLLAINNGVNSVSRILTGVLADTFGRQNILILSVMGSAASVLGLWMISAVDGAKGPWLAFVVFYGILAGGYNALFPVTITDVFGIQAYASVNGFIYFTRGLGAAFGSPVGGQILGDSRSSTTITNSATVLGDYRKLIWYDGGLLLASTVCVLGVRAFDAIEKNEWRWKA